MSEEIKIVEKMRKVIETDTTKYRERLNKKIHVVDISFSALKYSDPKLTQAEYSELLSNLENKFKVSNSLKRSIEVVRDPSAIAGYAAIVEDPTYGNYLVAKSYAAIQTRVASVFKALQTGNKFTGTDEEGKTVVNIGHIPSSAVTAAKSPLSEKFTALLTTAGSTTLASAAVKAMEELYTTHVKAEYSFNRPNFDLKGFNKILGTAVVLVTIHTAEINNELAILEKTVSTNLSNSIKSYEMMEAFLNIKGSNSIKEDIVNAIVVAAGGKGNGKNKHSPKTPVQIIDTKVKTKPPSVNILKLPNRKTGRMIGLPRLLTLINGHLHDVVSANMGDGDARNVLNFRTGRFATSTNVERLTISRQGAITAFYSYMENPYATFSEGGRQQFPRSRDPKLLISKSIREIAAVYVGNEMRTVNV